MRGKLALTCGFIIVMIFVSGAGSITKLTSPAQFIYPTTPINFDDGPSQTYANNRYLGQGIKFSRDDGGETLLLNWENLGRETTSPPNVICTMAYYTSNYHYNYTTHLNANFLQPTFEVGAFFGNDGDDDNFHMITLSVFDKQGLLLGSVSAYTNDNLSVDQFIGLRSEVPFSRARFQNNGTDRCVALDNMSFSVPEPATPPVADADGPYAIYVGDTLTLDASGSTDVDDDIVSYVWDLDDDDDETFETDAGGQAIFTVDYAYLESLELLINHPYTISLKVTDSENQSDIAGSTLTIVPKPALAVAVDIKPCSCPNPLNTKSSSVLPVAILGSEDVNVIDIDPTSVRLAGVEPLRSSYEDVAGPVSDSNDCNCVEAGPDGLLDLTLKFETQGIVKAIGDVNDGDVLTLELTGVLYDPIPFETPIEGADCILIKGWHKAHNKADINKDGVVDMTDFAIISENWLQRNE